MSISTIIGFVVGFGLFVVAILQMTDNYMAFIDAPSAIMVFGGTIASTYIGFEGKFVTEALKMASSIFSINQETQVSLKDEVGRIIRWGYIVQKNGLQGLEADSNDLREKDNFFSFAIDLVITGYTGDEIRELITNTVDLRTERAAQRYNILKEMAGAAPAFGMMGTLVGLVVMLQSMDDPDAIGPGMAAALITTFYGVIAARLVFMPSSSKLKQREETIQFKNYLLTEGLALLSERKSPRYIQDKMNSFLAPEGRYDIDTDMKEKP
ncbi:MAG: flagellar motor protein MotA [Alphaproteobacteria bacterium]|nr:flagellar motor protein MotA [Alphaproteobacteria bacterium]